MFFCDQNKQHSCNNTYTVYTFITWSYKYFAVYKYFTLNIPSLSCKELLTTQQRTLKLCIKLHIKKTYKWQVCFSNLSQRYTDLYILYISMIQIMCIKHIQITQHTMNHVFLFLSCQIKILETSYLKIKLYFLVLYHLLDTQLSDSRHVVI